MDTPPRIEILPTDALLVIDMQRDFCPGGALAVPGGNSIVDLINRLSHHFQHVIATQDWHPADHVSFAATHGKQPLESTEVSYGRQVLWPAHCVQDTPGAELHPGLKLKNLELILRKGFRKDIDSYSAFVENDGFTLTGLAGYLRDRGINRLFLCGLATDYCVAASAEDGSIAGFASTVLEDASRGISPEIIESRKRDLFKADVAFANSNSIL